jgi:hypothetical protein
MRSVPFSKKMTDETLMITHSGTSAQISSMCHGQGDAIVQQFRGLKSHAAPQTAAPAEPVSDPIEQLERLAALRDQGILTDEEFQAKKTKLLGDM